MYDASSEAQHVPVQQASQLAAIVQSVGLRVAARRGVLEKRRDDGNAIVLMAYISQDTTFPGETHRAANAPVTGPS